MKKGRKSGTDLASPPRKAEKHVSPLVTKSIQKPKKPMKDVKLNGSAKSPRNIPKEAQTAGKKAEKTSSTAQNVSSVPAMVASKNSKTPNKKSVDKENIGSSLVEDTMLKAFVDAVFELPKKKDPEEKVAKLFEDDETEKINLIISSIKLPSDSRSHVLKIELPHSCLPEPKDVCLIVKDLQKGLKVDHEPTTTHFRSLLADKGIGADLVSAVMPLRELKVEYKAFEAKSALCHKYDAFLVDDRIVKFVPKFLGKAFYKRKKFPLPIDLTSKNLRGEIEAALRMVTLPLSHHGPCAMVQVGHLGLAKSEVIDNLKHVFDVLKTRFPGGWKNIRSMHLKTEKSMSVPIYVSETCANDLGFVDASKPEKKRIDPIVDEISTQPGLRVTVNPGGKVKVERVHDPIWEEICRQGGDEESDDDANNEDEDDSEAEDKEGKEDNKETKKLTKTKEGKKSNTEKQEQSTKLKKKKAAKEEVENEKKKGKKKKVEESSDDDEDVEAAEQIYLRQRSDGGNETNEDKNASLQGKESDSDEDMDSIDEVESFDDDQEVDDDDVIRDEDGEEEDEEDLDDALVLKNQPQAFGDNESDAEEEVKPKRGKGKKKDRKLAAKQRNKQSPAAKPSVKAAKKKK